MERLTKRGNDNVVRYKKDGLFLEPCEIPSYGDIKTILDRLAYYEDMEEQGRFFIPPCAVGERWKDEHGEIIVVDAFHFDKWAGWSIYYHHEEIVDEEEFACNEHYFKSHFTREEAEQALKGGAN